MRILVGGLMRAATPLMVLVEDHFAYFKQSATSWPIDRVVASCMLPHTCDAFEKKSQVTNSFSTYSVCARCRLKI